MRRPKLVNNWHACWRWFSVQLIAVAGALQGVMLAFPETMARNLGDTVSHWAALVVLVGAVLGRVVDQNKEPPDVGDCA